MPCMSYIVQELCWCKGSSESESHELTLMEFYRFSTLGYLNFRLPELSVLLYSGLPELSVLHYSGLPELCIVLFVHHSRHAEG